MTSLLDPPHSSPAADPSARVRLLVAAREHGAFVALVLTGAILEFVLITRLLRPFSLRRWPGPQLDAEPFTGVLGPGGLALASFLLTLSLVIGLYFLALALAGRVDPRRLLPVAVVFGVVYALTLWPTIALGSTDLYHYILDGRALAFHGGNPLATPPRDFWNDELADILYFNRENTGAYGPLFYLLAAAAAVAGHGDLVWSTIAMKSVAIGWLLGCLPLVYLLAERMRPGFGAAAVLAFAWNPLVLFEVPGSGHNDIGVAFFALLAVWLAVSGRWLWAMPVLALGVLVKPSALLLLPALVAWLWFRPRPPSGRQFFLSLGLAVAVVVAFYVPFWDGAQTFSQLRHIAGLRMNSPADAVTALAQHKMDPELAVERVKLLATAAFLLSSGLVLALTRGPRPRPLVAAAFWCLFAYLMLASWWFWPWYLLPLVAFGAVLWPGRAGTLMAVFSASALLLYAALGWRLLLFTYENALSQAIGMVLIGFLAPALVWVAGWWKQPSDSPA